MSIKISPKHGVNPTIPICFFCGKEKNELILLGRIKDDKEAPKNMVFDKEPCDECKKYMEMGVMLVSVKDGTDQENPYRTGKISVIKEEAAKRIFPTIGDNRFAFVEDSVWEMIGL